MSRRAERSPGRALSPAGRPARQTRPAAAAGSCQHPVARGRPTSDPPQTVVDHLREHPLPFCIGRRGRVTQYADSLTAATPPRRIDGSRSASGAPLPACHRSAARRPAKYAVIQKFQRARRGRRTGHRAGAPPGVASFGSQSADCPVERRDVAAMPVDEDESLRPAGCRPAVLQQHRAQGVGTDGDGSGEAWCSPLSP